jgi:hypothetical protein
MLLQTTRAVGALIWINNRRDGTNIQLKFRVHPGNRFRPIAHLFGRRNIPLIYIKAPKLFGL